MIPTGYKIDAKILAPRNLLGGHASKLSGPEGVTSTVPALTKSDLLTKGHVMAEVQSSVTYREVPEFPGYRVGDDGSVWSRLRNCRNATVVDGWHRLVGSTDKDGYRKVILCNRGRRTYWRVNVLVLTVFVGPPNDMANPTSAHENGDNQDNRLSNLRWDTQKANIADKARHGTTQRGDRSPNRVLNEAQVVEILKRLRNGSRVVDLAEHFDVRPATISAIKVGRNWGHLQKAASTETSGGSA